jgi:Helix-turn-helix domain
MGGSGHDDKSEGPHRSRGCFPALTGVQVHQPDVSNLLRGKLSKFSTAKLITFAVRLNLGVHVKLTEPKKQKGIAPRIFSAKAGKKDRELVDA